MAHNPVLTLATLVDELEVQASKGEFDTRHSQKLRNVVSDLNNSNVGAGEAADLRIWNLCIAHSVQSADHTNVFLRHIACDVLAVVQARVSANEDDLLTIIRFFGKTGSLWKEVHSYALAETCFQTAMEFWQRLEKEFPAASTAATTKRNTVAFPIYCWRAEMAWEQKEKEMPYILVTRAKELLQNMPEEVYYLAMKCYNLALRYYNNKDMTEAIKWLEESHSIYSMDTNKDPQKQARTLKLLANAYVNIQNYSKAMSAIALANDEAETSSGLYLAAKIQFLLGHTERGVETVLRTVSASDCPFEVGLAACSLAIEHSATFHAPRALEILATRHQLDPREAGAVLALQIAFFLSPKTQDLLRATELLEGVVPSRIPRESAQQIYTAIWRYVSTIFNKDPSASLDWFKRALVFTQSTATLSPEELIARSKCMRMIARCHVSLSQYKEALEVASQAANLAPELAASQFLMFKVHVSLGDVAAATDVLHKLSSCIDICPGFLEVCAQEANEAGHASVAVLALMCALRQRSASGSSGASEEVGQLSAVLRCLVKLTLTGPQPDYRQLCEAMQLGADSMNRFGASQVFSNSTDELGWLVSVNWNQGLDCAKSGEYEYAHKLFRLTHEFSSQQALLTSPSLGSALTNIVETQLVSLLLASATALERKTPKQEEEARTGYQSVLGLIDRCNEVTRRLQDLGSDAAKRAKPLIILMEFKARALLKDPSLSQFLSYINAQSLPVSVFESVAEICMDTNSTQLCVEALKTCMRLRSTEPTINYEKYSKIFRQLIVLPDTKEAALAHYDEVGRILQGLGSGVWPTIELQWLFTTAWNNGVYFYRMMNYSQAERWMAQAILLLKYYPSTEKVVYEKTMIGAYSEVLTHVRPEETLISKGL